ncbi:DJ-1/PfpI family protein [Lysinibacillus xylanilyticus]|uniref:DJ-1/PfpI family protein n=1 Tax=Lysinibacillus xylanilyticus TaxID=582475 RepID=UPI003D09466D
MMTREIAVFISEGYADWELGYICPELNNSEKNFRIVTIALTKETVCSLGVLKIIPDYSIEDYLTSKNNECNMDMLLLCGGITWKEKNYEITLVKKLVDYCQQNNVLISAICDATTFLAYNGYLNEVEHTGNSHEFIVNSCPNYCGSEFYIEKQCVSSDYFITANGTATLEFAKEIMNHLKVYSEEKLQKWYDFYKNGFYEE